MPPSVSESDSFTTFGRERPSATVRQQLGGFRRGPYVTRTEQDTHRRSCDSPANRRHYAAALESLLSECGIHGKLAGHRDLLEGGATKAQPLAAFRCSAIVS